MKNFLKKWLEVPQKPYVVEKIIERIKVVEVPKIVNVIKEVPIDVVVKQEVIREVPVDKVVIQEVIKTVEIPKIVEKIVIERVEVPVIKEVPKLVEVKHTTREIVEAPLKNILTCDHDGHDWGRVKQWIVDGKVIRNQKCRRCGVMK